MAEAVASPYALAGTTHGQRDHVRLRIEQELGAEAKYAGIEAFPVPLPGMSC